MNEDSNGRECKDYRDGCDTHRESCLLAKEILTDYHGGWPRCVGGLAADTKRSK